MTVPLLDVNAMWSKIKAGWKESPMWNRPSQNPNPTDYKEGRNPMAMQVQLVGNAPKPASAFGGKTFSQRK